MSRSKLVSEMSQKEIETYQHGPETDLCHVVCRATEKDEYAELKDYLQRLSENSPQEIHCADSVGMTALHCAVACNSLPAVILLLKFGAYVNAKDLLGFTPLFMATGRYPNVDIAWHLIQDGKASVNGTNIAGATALHGAAVQGNTECVKLLLKNGADPRMDDHEGTTAFDLAKDENIRIILHDAVIEADIKREESNAKCSYCKKAVTDLKRCSRCQLVMYCNRDCQTQHWFNGHKNECSGFVIARPNTQNGSMDDTQMSFYHVMGSHLNNVKMFSRKPHESADRMEFLRKKRFIVKVQVPLGNSASDMMVYNADRSCQGFIHHAEKDYDKLAQRIKCEGFRGIKAYFWADLCEGKQGEVKVYHGKTAPFQSW